MQCVGSIIIGLTNNHNQIDPCPSAIRKLEHFPLPTHLRHKFYGLLFPVKNFEYKTTKLANKKWQYTFLTFVESVILLGLGTPSITLLLAL